jgi:hypothetical protein
MQVNRLHLAVQFNMCLNAAMRDDESKGMKSPDGTLQLVGPDNGKLFKVEHLQVYIIRTAVGLGAR